MDINVWIHVGSEDRMRSLEDKLDKVLTALTALQQQGAKMTKEMDDLEKEVAANSDTVDSAVVLLGNLSQMIKDAGTDPVKLAALTQKLDTDKQKLAKAVVASTPAAPGGGGTGGDTGGGGVPPSAGMRQPPRK